MSTLSEAEKDCLILNLWPLAGRVQELKYLIAVLQARIAALETQLREPPRNVFSIQFIRKVKGRERFSEDRWPASASPVHLV
ncbi:hypothetical protein JL100_026395 [Skermanella mucosa]|uniref:hypothetical protein n=1 Tax=Skermanella mucosa TaxID=1789672 RepID=UPI00192C5004|nr:hypothetical protein [Skermanella mucosa]UEM24176.1 hypothetical protein JL100_026395 [Skermanella mucosa]